MRSLSTGTRRRLKALAAGVAAVLAALACVLALPSETAERWREFAVDRLLLAFPAAPQDTVVVVDIDDRSLDAFGPWPWPRDVLAALMDAVAAGLPRAVGIDILLSGPDRAAPAALARRIALASGDQALAARIEALPDPDERLAVALSAAPTALAFLMGDTAGQAPEPVPLLVEGTPPRLSPWGASGAELPLPAFAQAVAGLGGSSLEGDADGRVRRVPLLLAVGDTVLAGFAAEVLRIAEGEANLLIDAGRGSLTIGSRRLPLVAAADLRFRPTRPETWARRTVSAVDVIEARVPEARFAGRIVLIGGGAPALGGLRAGAASPVLPSVQIQADAVATMMAGVVPYRPAWLGAGETAAALGLAVAAATLGAFAAPVPAAIAALALALVWSAGAGAALLTRGLVVDPIGPGIGVVLAVIAAGTVSAVDQRRAAALLRRRFAQHLPPSVVERIAEQPDLVKLDGERREVTALFTDLEGFTAVTERVGPVELVRLLDAYFDGVIRILVAHGGMVDKIVGDAVHALFNAPVDLPEHPRRAVEAALAICVFSDSFRRRPDVAAAGFGRTRIGIETGDVVIGDVGAGAKLDYTAHGTAVNTAARLEAANKDLGSTICVGPVCRSRLPDMPFRGLGAVDIRGRGRLDLFEPLG